MNQVRLFAVATRSEKPGIESTVTTLSSTLVLAFSEEDALSKALLEVHRSNGGHTGVAQSIAEATPEFLAQLRRRKTPTQKEIDQANTSHHPKYTDSSTSKSS